VATLTIPNLDVHVSFLAALVEYHREGRLTHLSPNALTTPEEFTDYLQTLAAESVPETLRSEGIVPQTTLWWIDEAQFLGRISIRHTLTPALRRVGGHIGYDIRPTARRQGHATAMLHATLPAAAALGIDPALITCDRTNTASRRVIETNGGRLWQADEGKLRFWVPTRG
jgi:predicted acetyltransferase